MLNIKSQLWNLWEFDDGLPTIPWAFLQGIYSTTNKYQKSLKYKMTKINIKKIFSIWSIV